MEDKAQKGPTGQKLKHILERAKAEWEAAFDSISEGIAMVEPDGTVRRVNNALAELLGRDVRSLIGSGCCDLFGHHRVDDSACPVLNFPDGKQGTFEVFFPDYRYYEESIHPITGGGEVQGFVITVKDVTSQQLVDQERKHMFLQVDEANRKRRLAEDALDDLRAELVRAEKRAALGDLTSIVFSELNRAVRTLHDGLEILADRCGPSGDALSGECQAVLSELLATAGRSSRILDKLGALGTDDSDNIVEIDINKVIEEVVADLADHAKKAGVELVINRSQLGLVEGSRDQIAAVISSLVLNAIDGTSATNGTVSVTTGVESECARVEVSDTGQGIQKAHIAHIFAPFFTTDPKSTKVGMGLTICQAIVRGHRGHIQVDSEPDRGTTVKLLLPLVG